MYPFDAPVLPLLPVRRLRRRQEKKSEGRPGTAAPGLPSLFFSSWGGVVWRRKEKGENKKDRFEDKPWTN